MMEVGSNATVVEGIEEIRRSSHNASTMIQQLMAFSRKQSLTPEIFDVGELLRKLEKLLFPLIGENIELSISVDHDDCCIHADPTQIEQTIINLCINARDAMPNGGAIAVATRRDQIGEDSPIAQEVAVGDYLVISVADTGCGMEEEIVGQIFDPFFTTKRVGKGSGLGLSLVYGIVRQSKGHIDVSSTVGVGTTFELFFPVAETVEFLEKSVQLRSAAAQGGLETILFVEDEESLRRITRKTLTRLGYTVIEAENGIEALKTLEEHGPEAFDLLLTDVVMPEMGGLELWEKSSILAPQLRVLFISGYTGELDVRQDVLNPDLTLLQKPFSLVDLSRRIRKILDSKG